MRTTIVAGALLAFSLLTATPALAAPEITQRSCEAEGGVFTRVQGVKKCTSVTAAEVARTYGQSPYVTLYGPLTTTQTSSGYSESRLQGISRHIDWIRTTTVRSQKGSGPVTTTVQQVTVSTRVHEIECEMWYADYDAAGTVLRAGAYPQPDPDCAALGLFLTP